MDREPKPRKMAMTNEISLNCFSGRFRKSQTIQKPRMPDTPPKRRPMNPIYKTGAKNDLSAGGNIPAIMAAEKAEARPTTRADLKTKSRKFL